MTAGPQALGDDQNSMAQVDEKRFLELLKLSCLVDDARLEKSLSGLTEAVRKDVDKLSQHLIDDHLITRWQADNLLSGKHKGFRLGSYRLLRKLGRGGMSTVYLAQHELMRRQAAIKVLPRRRVADSSYLARFHREAQAAAALDHPNIVRIYDVAADGNVHYIAMEFIDGQDLQTLVASEGRLDFDKAADYIAQAALGMQHAHDINLIHRDIKPANLLANEKGVIKLLDMGLAKFDEDEDATSLTIEHDENVLGTVDYLAPEQALDSHNVDHRADIYSLGCTLYYLLTGHAPFPDGSLAQRLMKHQKVKPASLIEKRPETPPELIKICEQMMEKSVEKRTQSSALVAEQLGAWLASRGKSVTGDSAAGSRIGVAASLMRELAAAQELNATATSTAVEEQTDDAKTDEEADRDTTISRSQDETRKSTPPPPLMPDELELAVAADEKTGQASGSPSASTASVADDDLPPVDLSELEQQLRPLRSNEEGLMRGGSIRVASKLNTERKPEGLPQWVWIVGSVTGLLLLVLIAIAVMSIT